MLKDHKKEKWSTIDYQFMTDESDTEEGVVLQHKLIWRSEGTYCFMLFVSFYIVYSLNEVTKIICFERLNN